ncbi:hypothetical protein MLD55_08565 [Alcanivorax sp. MM125-6]|nr:hypothetical protein [Alcanivorax sp. MM125-6]
MLDLVLGHAFKFRSCGELISGLSRYPEQRCTCGLKMQECGAWRSSIQSIGESEQERTDLFCYLASKASIFQIHKAFFFAKDKQYEAALLKESRFIEALKGDCDGVIDSSKELTRGVALALGPSKASWLHIYRNPEQIAASYRFRAKKGKIKIYRRLYSVPNGLLFLLDLFVATSWSIWTILTILTGAIAPKKYVCVSYEQFLKDPVGHAYSIGEKFGVSVDKETIRERVSSSLTVGHIVGGNRMSQERTFSLKASESTQRSVSISTTLICFFICSPVKLLARCMYKRAFSRT